MCYVFLGKSLILGSLGREKVGKGQRLKMFCREVLVNDVTKVNLNKYVRSTRHVTNLERN